MVDKDPVARWTFGRVTLAGDAAHPMYPRGSNGAAQGAIDARTLADCLARRRRPARCACAPTKRRGARRPPKIVRTNREHPPDFINIKVEELIGDRPFDNLDDYITQDELRALSENYKRIAGFLAHRRRRARTAARKPIMTRIDPGADTVHWGYFDASAAAGRSRSTAATP